MKSGGNGLGAALVGGVVAALVATGVVLATRAYELRHAREQEARAATQELMKASLVYLNAIGEAFTNSHEHQTARWLANWTWTGAAQVAQGYVAVVSPELSQRMAVAAERSKTGLETVAAASVGPGDEAWKVRMFEALKTATGPVLRLNTILGYWIWTGKVLDFDE
jgi:hypothetical protein